MYALAPGFSDTPEKFDLAVLLTRIAFPYLLCMSLVALLSGALNSLGRFTMAAAAPILLNIVLIVAMLLAAGLGSQQHTAVGHRAGMGRGGGRLGPAGGALDRGAPCRTSFQTSAAPA